MRKRILLLLLLTILVVEVGWVYAVALDSEIQVTNLVFTDFGTINSFAVNENGDVLISVNSGRSDIRYVMLFGADKTLLKTYELDASYNIRACFGDQKNIILFQNRSRYAMVIDEKGNIIEEYEDTEGRSYELEEKNTLYFENTVYHRNFWKNKITRTTNGRTETFFEIKNEMALSFIIWLTLAFAGIWLFRHMYNRDFNDR